MKRFLLAVLLALSFSACASAQVTGTAHTGTLKLDGATSGATSVITPATTTNHTVTLPANVCSSGQTWTDNGSGVMSCASGGGAKSWFGGSTTNIGATTEKIYSPWGPAQAGAANESTGQFSVPFGAGTFKNLYCSAGTAPATTAITVKIFTSATLTSGYAAIGTPSAITCTIAVGNTIGTADTTNTGTVTAGTFVVIDVNNASSTGSEIVAWGGEFDPS